MTEPGRKLLSRRLTVAVAAGLCVLGAVAAWYGLADRAGRQDVAAAPECRAAEPVVKRIAALARGEVAALGVAVPPKLMPDLAFQGPSGAAMSLADLKGKTILVNLWATWCVPCREEMPALDRLQTQLGGQDFEVVAINVDTRNPDKPKAWLQENGIKALSYYADPQATILQVLQRTGHVVGLPTTLLVDPGGCELAVLKGPAEWASRDALALMRAVLGRPT